MAFGALLGQTASGGGGKRVCRFTVGTSTAGWTSNDCDYLCDGTDDQVEINAAIQALPSTGGEIVILDGTYNITAAIIIKKNNVTLSGNGSSTVLKRMWNSSASIQGIINVAGDNIIIENFYLDGSIESATPYNIGILCNGDQCIIKKNIIANNASSIHNSGNNNVIIENICNNNSNAGINTTFSSHNIIINNICNNNSIGIGVSSNFNNITNNICKDNTKAINITGNSNVINSNTCMRGTGQSSDYTTSQYTIQVASGSSNNLFVGNNIMGKNYVDNGTNNTWANNKYN